MTMSIDGEIDYIVKRSPDYIVKRIKKQEILDFETD